jgi:hypothetical protein
MEKGSHSTRKKSLEEINFLRLLTRCEQHVLSSSKSPELLYVEQSILNLQQLLRDIAQQGPIEIPPKVGSEHPSYCG